MNAPAKRWGGARAGAGRPKRGAIASEPHKQRPALVARQPQHVIARVVRAAGALHGRDARRALARALRRSLGHSEFRIVHLRITSHIELVVEATDRIALARGMQGFQVAAAKHLNRLRGRSGPVFADRYRAHPLRTFAAVRGVIGTSPPRPLHGLESSSLRSFAWIAAAWPETGLLLERGPP
jgi:REP-associated tyrosine transposase